MLGYLYWWVFTWGVIGINDAYPWNTDLWGPFTPGLVLNGNAAVSLVEFLLLEFGVDMGVFNPKSVDDTNYLSFFPYLHFLFGRSGVYAGTGLGRMFTIVGNYERTEWPNAIRDSFAMDFIFQVELEGFSIQYIYRLDFQGGHYFNMMFGFYIGER